MKYIKQLQAENQRKGEVIAELKEALRSLVDYARSAKFNATERDPIPHMNPADVVHHVSDWQRRIGDVELNGRTRTDFDDLTAEEVALVERWIIAARKHGYVKRIVSVKRGSFKAYDVHIHGEQSWKHDGTPLHAFSAWLPLAAINDMINWTHPNVAKETNYEQMALEGDWSAVRDSDPDRIWRIFEQFVLGGEK